MNKFWVFILIISGVMKQGFGFRKTFPTLLKQNLLSTARFDKSELPIESETKFTPIKQFDADMNKIKRGFMFGASLMLGSLLANSQSALAIGNLYELKNQSVVLQDISLNVIETDSESNMFEETFEKTCKVLRKSKKNGVNITVLSFGPDQYEVPSNFIPGISPFSSYGGHATLSLVSERIDEDTVIGYEIGNGLSFIKIGIETLRVSKALVAGAKITSGYGYVEMGTPQGIPLQVIIGERRDPIMNIGLKVSNMTASIEFFKDTLGMKELPFQLARPVGSQFEPPQPPGSVYLGYSEETMGVLLIPPAKGEKINIGSQLRGFKLVYDDSSRESLPQRLRDADSNSIETVKSPDGYPFFLVPFSKFTKDPLLT